MGDRTDGLLADLKSVRQKLERNHKARVQLLADRRRLYAEAADAEIPVTTVARTAGVSIPAVLQQTEKAREEAL